MTSNVAMVAAEHQRQRIPALWLMEFEDWTNASLAGLSADPVVGREIKAWAGWELEYREAFNVVVDYDPSTWQLRRRRARKGD